jgi:hypothetical protein
VAGARPLALAALATGAALGPAGAADAATKITKYDVTFEVEGKRSWTFKEASDSDCTGGRCAVEELASGSERIVLQTPKPQRVDVFTFGGKQQPMLMGDTEATLRLTGNHLLQGTHTVTYTGGWDAANPDTVHDASDCGNRSLKETMAFNWVGRNRLALVPAMVLLREGCPSALPYPADGVNGAKRPELSDVVAAAAQAKFGRTRQFTIRGAVSWQGVVPVIDRSDASSSFHRSGQEELSWQWRATFRKVAAKKGRRR